MKSFSIIQNNLRSQELSVQSEIHENIISSSRISLSNTNVL